MQCVVAQGKPNADLGAGIFDVMDGELSTQGGSALAHADQTK